MRRASAFSTALGAPPYAAALHRRRSCVGGAMLVGGTARALDAYGQLEDPALQARYERIIHAIALSRLSERIDRRLECRARRRIFGGRCARCCSPARATMRFLPS